MELYMHMHMGRFDENGMKAKFAEMGFDVGGKKGSALPDFAAVGPLAQSRPGLWKKYWRETWEQVSGQFTYLKDFATKEPRVFEDLALAALNGGPEALSKWIEEEVPETGVVNKTDAINDLPIIYRESVKRLIFEGISDKYDERDREAIWIYVEAALFRKFNEYQMLKKFQEMGYDVDLGPMEKFEMPPLERFAPRMKKELGDYIKRQFP